MTTYNTLPDLTELVFGRGNDKIISAGPFTIAGVVQSCTGKTLRVVLKALPETDDASAVIDLNSDDDPTLVTPSGTPADGVWAIDLRNQLPTPGLYHLRLDLATTGNVGNTTETVGLASVEIRHV